MSDKSHADLLAFFDTIRVKLASAPTELVGHYTPAKRWLGIPRSARISVIGAAWHLGALLITKDAVFETGEITRSLEPVRKGYSALSARERDEQRFAAYRGGVPEGRAVHFNWTPIDLTVLADTGSAGILRIADGELQVRWSPAGGYAPLESYLAERIELALGRA